MKIFAETERLVLRELLLSDAEGMFELDRDKEVHRYLGNKPIKTIQQSIDIITFVQKQYIDNGIGRWAVIEKETNEFIGWSGLKLVQEKINNHVNYYNIGYRLRRKFWGKGIATETSIIARNYGFQQLKLKEIYGTADSQNIASKIVLQKIGLKYIETFHHNNMRLDWFKISADIK